MPDILAIVSKAVFEAQAPDASPGATLPLDRYTSNNPGLKALAEGGRLFMVTVRPPDEQLWLVGVLENPKHDGKAWVAKTNAAPVRDVSAARSKIRFTSDTGISSKKGALGMSLQTPRALTAADVALLLGGTGAKPKASVESPRSTEKPKKSSAVASASSSEKSQTPAARGDDWGELQAALEKKHWSKALDLARARWETTRSPELAELIQSVGAQLPAATSWKLEGTGSNLASALALLTVDVRFADSLKRLQQVLKLPADPRISAQLINYLLSPPFTAQSSRAFWTALFDALEERLADPLAITRLEPALPKYLQVFGGTVMGTATKKRIEALLATLKPRFASGEFEVLPAGVRAAVPKVAEKPKAVKGSLEALVEAVYADPDADGPREVLADALLEKNDPRGEFMTLQLRRHRGETLSPAEQKQEAALQKKHGKEWAGVLAGCTYVEQNVFERGFVRECRLRLLGGKLGPAMNHPAWSTVRTMHLAIGGTRDHGAELLTQPAMVRLEALYDAPYDVLQALTQKGGAHQLQFLEIGWLPESDADDDCFDPTVWDPMLTMKSLPKLKTLHFSTSHVHPRALATFWSSPLARRLERVELRPHYGVDGAIIPIAHAEAPAGLTVLVQADGAEVLVQRGKPLVLRAFEPERRTPREPRSDEQLAKDLERFIAGLPKSLSLRVEGLPAQVVALVKKRVAKVEVG